MMKNPTWITHESGVLIFKPAEQPAGETTACTGNGTQVDQGMSCTISLFIYHFS